jgi:hypothetical protein
MWTYENVLIVGRGCAEVLMNLPKAYAKDSRAEMAAATEEI